MTNEILSRLHTVLQEILDEFVKICEENNILYFITAGTLLGAIRHKGFIPWDDDIDIAMPRDDYEKFISIFDNLHNKNFYLLSYKNKAKYARHCKCFAKLCKANTIYAESYREPDRYSGIFIDLFPFDNCIKFLVPIHTKIVIFFREVCRIENDVIKMKDKWKHIFARYISWLLSERFINNSFQKMHKIFNKLKTKYISFFSGRYHYTKETHKYNDIFPLTKVLFEGKFYNAPKNWDLFLKRLYGNYMEIPPPEKRHIHTFEYIDFGDQKLGGNIHG